MATPDLLQGHQAPSRARPGPNVDPVARNLEAVHGYQDLTASNAISPNFDSILAMNDQRQLELGKTTRFDHISAHIRPRGYILV